MRRFVVVGHTQKAEAPIPLNDPAGAGRWDVLARAVAAALLVSNGIRRDTELYLVLTAGRGPRTLVLRGASIKNLNPDERAILGLLGKALATPSVGAHEADASPGVSTAAWSLRDVLERLLGEGPLVLLHEHAPPLESLETARRLEGATFVLSDHEEFRPEELRVLAGPASGRYSLGPVSLHTSSCIVLAHNWLDRAAHASGSGPGATAAEPRAPPLPR